MSAIKASTAMLDDRTSDLINERIAYVTKKLRHLKDRETAKSMFFELQGFRTGLYCIQPLPEAEIRKVGDLISKCVDRMAPANEEKSHG